MHPGLAGEARVDIDVPQAGLDLDPPADGLAATETSI
jgi:hypothetical protein